MITLADKTCQNFIFEAVTACDLKEPFLILAFQSLKDFSGVLILEEFHQLDCPGRISLVSPAYGPSQPVKGRYASVCKIVG